jgi:CHAT domain-containing protein/Tfp pilus assembly protein PilF
MGRGAQFVIIRVALVAALLTVSTAWSAALPSEAEIRALLAAGQYGEAEVAARAAVDQLDGSSEPALAEALDLLVEVLIASDRAADPETAELAERAVGLRRAAGASSPVLAVSQARFGEVLTARRELDRAAAVLTEAESLVGENDPLPRAMVLNRLGALRRVQGEAVEARRIYATALDELDRSGAAWDSEVERSLRGLGGSSYSIGDYHSARRAYQRLYDGQVAVLGEGAVEVAVTRRHLAMTESALGNLDAAEALYLEALATLEARVGPSHLEVAAAVNGLAVVARKRGDLLQARRQLERSLEIMEEIYGPMHREVAGTLNNLGNVLGDLGDLDAARQAFERALAIREGSPSPNPLEVAQSLSNLGGLLRREGHLEGAVILLERALAMREAGSGPDSRLVALTLANLGDALREAGELDRSQTALERSVAILERGPDRDSRNLFAALNNLGLVQLQQGESAEAVATLARAREELEGARGHGHPQVTTVIANQAVAAALGGQLDLALGLALEAERVGRSNLQMTATGLSERQALLIAAEHQKHLELALAIAVEGSVDDPTLIAATWDALVRSRGLVLEELIARRQWLRAAAGGGASPLIAHLSDAAQRLSRLLVEGEGPAPAAEVEAARAELEAAERALGEASRPFAIEVQRLRLGLDEVTWSLPPGSALAAYARFNREAIQSSLQRFEAPEPWYLALVRSAAGQLELVPLADAATIDRLAREWRAAAGRPSGGEQATRQAGERLRELIWDPVSARVGDAKLVFVVPDGELGLLNLAALPASPDAFLAEQGPPLAMLAEERELVPDPFEATRSACLLAIGAPDFDAAPDGRTMTAAAAANPDPGSSRSSPEDLARSRFTSLPGTAAETAAVTELWRRADPRAEALRLTGGEATEAAVKVLAPGFRVLHLATHGFFLGGSADPPAGSDRGVGAIVPAGAVATPTGAFDQLKLSGLALAGANRRDLAGVEDGILTAEEVAALDLSGVEWAVLSACESGVGEVSGLEGVFGLRRAFRVAGARTVIMSLWAVDDEAAREWMSALYRARLVDGLPTAEAVRRASLDVLAARRQRGDSIHPAFWAAFVASGDWH